MAFEALLAELDTLVEDEGQPPGIYRSDGLKGKTNERFIISMVRAFHPKNI